ncbi:glycosyltransferase [Patescibacteria group bacterium]|nr:glycosyltransferase [Patescibacteria group bacterium]
MDQPKKLKVVLTGGGTGGHVLPLIPLAQALKEVSTTSIELTFMGVLGAESVKQLRAEGIDCLAIPSGKLRRYFDLRTVVDLLIKLPVGIGLALWQVAKLKPHVAVSKGGFGSLPTVIACRVLGVPILLHESDTTPGLANRIAARLSAVIATSWAQTTETLARFDGSVVRVGIPVRAEIGAQSLGEAKQAWNLSVTDPVILILGGSQGAQQLNDLVLTTLPQLLKTASVIHITGPDNHQAVLAQSALIPAQTTSEHRYLCLPYLTDTFASALSSADVVVTRAGATTLAELARTGSAAILLPLAGAAGGHQAKNAAVLTEAGAAITLEADVAAKDFGERIVALLRDDLARERLSNRIKLFDYPRAASVLAALALHLGGQKSELGTLLTAKQVGMIGIGGAGMRGLANLLQQSGKRIVGIDARHQQLAGARDLQHCSIVSEQKFTATMMKGCDVLLYSDAIPKEHKVRQLARAQGRPELSYQRALGIWSSLFRTVAVTGTHGKSSTAALLAQVIGQAGLQPTVLIGASAVSLNGCHSQAGNNALMIVEADEYRRHFLELRPDHVVLTNIDYDHPDYFADLAEVVAAYTEFLELIEPHGRVVMTTASLVHWPADTSWSKRVTVLTEPVASLKVPLPGEHMRQNAWLAITMAEHLGVTRQQGKKAVAAFPGLSRRFELLGSYGQRKIYSDYGHHPTELAATIAAAATTAPLDQWLVLLEPHTSNRLTAYFDAFVEVLAAGDFGVVVLPVFAARGETSDDMTKTSLQLWQAIKERKSSCVLADSFTELPEVLEQAKSHYEHVLAFTAGDLDDYLRSLIR